MLSGQNGVLNVLRRFWNRTAFVFSQEFNLRESQSLFFFCSRLNNQTTMPRQCRACERAREAKPSTERERASERGREGGRLNECFVPVVVTVKHSLSQIIPSDA